MSLDNAGVGRMLINSGDWAGQWVPLLHPEGAVDLSRKWPVGWPIGCTDDSLIVVRLNEEEEVETVNQKTPLFFFYCLILVFLKGSGS